MAYKLRFCTLIFAVLLAIFARLFIFQYSTFTYVGIEYFRFINNQNSVFTRASMNGVSLYGVRSATERRTHRTHVQLKCKLLKCWQCVAVLQLYVFCSVCELLSFTIVIVMSFVRSWRHIIFQYIQIHCDFRLTMKLLWFLLNLVWICLTNIQAAKLLSVVWPCTMHLQQRKRRGVIDVILLWRLLHWCPLHARNGLSFALHDSECCEPLCMKIYPRVTSEGAPGENKKWCYISRICPVAPLRPIGTNFVLWT